MAYEPLLGLPACLIIAASPAGPLLALTPGRYLQLVIQIAKSKGVHSINIVRGRPETAMQAVEQHLKGLGADVVTTEEKLREVFGEQSGARRMRGSRQLLHCIMSPWFRAASRAAACLKEGWAMLQAPLQSWERAALKGMQQHAHAFMHQFVHSNCSGCSPATPAGRLLHQLRHHRLRCCTMHSQAALLFWCKTQVMLLYCCHGLVWPPAPAVGHQVPSWISESAPLLLQGRWDCQPLSCA